jgi:hypothetical protein
VPCKKVGNMKRAIVNNHQKKIIYNDVILETRERVPEIKGYLENTLDRLQSLKYILDDTFDADEAFEILEHDLPDSTIEGQKESFILDIIRLCVLFSGLKKNSRMKIQIEVVKTNKCRLFHQDCYRQRLICTYVGPGTEWLSHENVNREALGKGKNENIVKDFTKINRAKAFEVLLLKGSKYDDNEIGIVHRSPPIEHDGKTRVLLKIDE